MSKRTINSSLQSPRYLDKVDDLTAVLDKLRPGTGGAINFLLRDAYEEGRKSAELGDGEPSPQPCPAKLNGDPPPTCRLKMGHSGDHESVQPHGILSWAAQEVSPEPRETDGHPVGWCCKHCYDGGYQAAMRLLAEGEQMNDDQIKHMVNRFLSWRLPDNFNPDGGISFKRMFNEHTSHPMKNEPVGTNLLDYTQAEAMIRYLVEGLQLGDTRELKAALEDCIKITARFVNSCDTQNIAATIYAHIKGRARSVGVF